MNFSLSSPGGQTSIKRSLYNWAKIRSAAKKLADLDYSLTSIERSNIQELDFESEVCRELSLMARSEDDHMITLDHFPPLVCSRCPVRQEYLKTGEYPTDSIICCTDYDVIYGLIHDELGFEVVEPEKFASAIPYIDSYIEHLESLLGDDKS